MSISKVELLEDGARITLVALSLGNKHLKLSVMERQTGRFLGVTGWSGQRRTVAEASATDGQAEFMLPAATVNHVAPGSAVLLEIAQLGVRVDARWPAALPVASPPAPLPTAAEPEEGVLSPTVTLQPAAANSLRHGLKRAALLIATLTVGVGAGALAGPYLGVIGNVPVVAGVEAPPPDPQADRLERETKVVKERLAAIENQRAGLEQSVAQLTTENSELRRQIAILDARRQVLEADLAQAVKRAEARPEPASDAVAPAAPAPQQDVATAPPTWPDLRAEAAVLKTERDGYKDERDRLQTQLDQLQASASTQPAATASTPPSWPDQRADVTILRSEKEMLKEQRNRAVEERDAMKLDRDRAIEDSTLSAALAKAQAEEMDRLRGENARFTKSKANWGAAVAGAGGKRISVSANQVDKPAAEKDAKAHCVFDTDSRDCQLLHTFYNSCFSVARPAAEFTRFDYYGWAAHPDIRTSQHNAVVDCEKQAGEACALSFSSCSPDYLNGP